MHDRPFQNVRWSFVLVALLVIIRCVQQRGPHGRSLRLPGLRGRLLPLRLLWLEKETAPARAPFSFAAC